MTVPRVDASQAFAFDAGGDQGPSYPVNMDGGYGTYPRRRHISRGAHSKFLGIMTTTARRSR